VEEGRERALDKPTNGPQPKCFLVKYIHITNCQLDRQQKEILKLIVSAEAVLRALQQLG
jgi:hypothetical protein